MRTLDNGLITYIVLILMTQKLLIISTAVAFPNVNTNSTEKFIEHQVTQEEAKVISVTNVISSFLTTAMEGCNECTKGELKYCSRGDVLYDHCCCDRKYQEVFPFIEHICYYEDDICQPIAKDCAEYSRLVDCCCRKYLATMWKTHFSKSSGKSIYKIVCYNRYNWCRITIMFYLYYLVNRYLFIQFE